MNQRGFMPIVAILIVVGILAAGAIIYFTGHKNPLPPTKQAIEQQYAQGRATGAQNPAPRNPNTPLIIVPGRPFETGIFNDCDSYHAAIIVNCWAGIVNGKEIVVSAGAEPSFLDPQQGVVCVLAGCVSTPVRAGAVHIIAEKNGILTLATETGSYALTFNVNTKTFTSVIKK